MKLIDGLETRRYLKGDYVIKEGEDGDYFYIVEEGVVECVKDENNGNIEKVHVRDLNRGEHFGELALINNVKRTLSVRVKSD
jgi:cAMP-dependent protein kinase regulator